MRPKRSTAVAAMALAASSSVMSACSTSHWPPSARTIAAVSSAESARRSTSRSCAPSRAKSSEVARPLPIVSPGVCPAPVMIATLPASRSPISSPFVPFAPRLRAAALV